MMRVTSQQVQARLLADLRAQLAAQSQATDQVSSGRRWTLPSEDPSAATRVLRTDASLRELAQHRRSVQSVRARLDAEEATVGQVTDILSRAKELAVSQGGASANATTRAAATAELNALLAQAVSLGNLRVGNEYLFGGVATDTPPFAADGTYSGTASSRQAEIGPGVVVPTVHSGQELMVDGGVYTSLIALRDAMAGNDEVAIRASIGGIDQAFTHVQARTAEVGARQNGLEFAEATFSATEETLAIQRKTDAEIPIEEAVLRLGTIQQAYEATMLAMSRLLNTSLTDYLR